MDRRVLVAGVGYSNLRDLSLGPLLVERLRRREWPPGVQVEDLSYGAIAVLHWLRENPPFDAALFVSAVQRGMEPGTIRDYRWSSDAATVETIQGCVTEAVTGVIGLETLLTVVGHFGALPRNVRVIEVEPRDLDWGPALSPSMQTAMEDVEAIVRARVRGFAA